MSKKYFLYPGMVLMILIFLGFSFLYSAAELDFTNPEAVANRFLESLRIDDYSSIIDLMTEEQKKDFLPVTEEKLKAVERLFSRDKKKANQITTVSELRKVTTFSGKPGIAAKVTKDGNDVYAVILCQEGEKYYYDSSYTLSADLYKNLELIKKIK